jgi:glycosyltransferase involved in cell wall biosynthesis
MLDDPVRARRMGAAGRERAVTTFSWPIVVDELEALYSELLTGGSRRPLEKAA